MDLNTMMEEERTRLQKLLEDIAERRVALDQEEGSINTELSALTAYFDTKLGKVTERQTANTKPRKRNVHKESVKSLVFITVREFGKPISKQAIIESMGASGNKSLQNGISNALVQLKKSGDVISGERGMYKLPDTPPTEPAEPKAKRVKKIEAWSQ